MTGLALLLILAAAFIHASWNFLLKRARGGTVFLWLSASVSSLIYLPLALAAILIQSPHLGWAQLGLMLASAALHTGYYTLLDKGYRAGDLSLVYPIARGTGPLITMLGAVLWLGERPSLLAVAGALLVGGGAILLTGNPRRLKSSRSLGAVGFALVTGGLIASYSLVDKLAVAVFLVPPIVQDWAANVGRVVLMTPLVLGQQKAVKAVWAESRRAVVAVALLCPLSYLLVLTAMTFTPVSYVAPAREVSILIAAAMGIRFLSEDGGQRRLLAAAIMVLGVMALALG